MRVCLSPGGPSIYSTNEPADEVFVATMEGVGALRRQAPGAGWVATSRGLQDAWVVALVCDPVAGTLFAGTFGDSLFASDDGGETWEPRASGIESDQIYSLNAIEVDGHTRVYAGTQPARLYVSDDGGASWRELDALRSVPGVAKWTFPNSPHVAHLKGIAFDPRSPDVIYAGVEVGGLFKSTDRGESWREMAGFGEEWNGDYHRLSIRPGRPDELFLSSGPGLWRSRDAGETWEHLTDRVARIGYPDGVIAHPEREDLLFVAGARTPPSWIATGTADARIARSRDGGTTWEMLERGLPGEIRGNIEAMSMNIWPGGFSLLATGIDGDVFLSEDEGDTWSVIAQGLPPIQGRDRPAPPLRAW